MKRLLIIALLAGAACRNHHFEQDEAKWRDQRRTRLTSDSSWLTLIGLHWLQPGTNDVTIAGAPPLTVRFVVANGVVSVGPNPKITIDGKPVTALTPLADDTNPKGPTIVKADTRTMQAIKRNDKFAIRAKDTQSRSRYRFCSRRFST